MAVIFRSHVLLLGLCSGEVEGLNRTGVLVNHNARSLNLGFATLVDM